MTDARRQEERATPVVQGDGDVVCGCTNLRLQGLQAALAADPTMTFEELLTKTGAGMSCTACLLDLEYYFVTLPRASRPGRIRPRRAGEKAPQTLRRRVYRLLDRLSPQVPMPLTEWMPVVVGEGIEEWVWVANQSLLYEGKECPPDFDIDIIVRTADGETVYQATHGVGQGSALRLNVSRFLPPPVRHGECPSLGVGSVQISRRARRPGFRGTIRPQIELVTPVGSCAVHSQAPGELPEQWFTNFYRPRDERIFLSVVNASARPLSVEFAYPFSSSGVDVGAPLIRTVHVPPQGARLHEIVLPDPHAEQFTGRLFSIRWRASGARKVHVLCATPTLDRFSIDHL